MGYNDLRKILEEYIMENEEGWLEGIDDILLAFHMALNNVLRGESRRKET